MEDLTEEPELEEREEEEEEEEDEEDIQEPDPQADVNKDDEPMMKEEQERELGEEGEDGSNDRDDEHRPVRDKAARRGFSGDEFDADDTQGLLETNFSVTGLNEIKTERVMPRAGNSARSSAAKRPISLDLNAPVKFRKLRGAAARPEKVTARLIDSDQVGHRSRGNIAGQVTVSIDDNN